MKNRLMKEMVKSIIWLNENKFKTLNERDKNQVLDLFREFRCLYFTAKAIQSAEEVADNEN